ncbi:hypothetical protein D9611_011378 [Ephemerocybe angulata]|uniref:Uncharacterized protein n=1 Tax=Ephemerocybe angulata TaxID=980116 RepID=A0A8H5BCD1_9AGAR|nr:hypothetical protein D9611_011378 [Tulosesus angulatus]
MNTETSLNRFQDLPEDLARVIFEESAADPDIPGWACARVSKKVQAWVEPILYREVIVEDHISISRLHTTVLSHPTKPEPFFSLHVRTLCIYTQEHDTSDDTIFDILSACPNLTQLDLSNFYKATRSLEGLRVGTHPSWDRPRLKRLRIPARYFSPSHRHFRFAEGQNLNPIFASITHFELHLSSPFVLAWDWGSFQYLPFLTHFCISMTPAGQPISSAACHLRSAVPYFPPSLIVCVFYIPYSLWLTDISRLVQENGRKVDERVVVALDEAYYLMIREGHPCSWLEDEATWRPRSVDRVVSERKDYLRAFWERAEAVITRRRREDNLKATVGCGS